MCVDLASATFFGDFDDDPVDHATGRWLISPNSLAFCRTSSRSRQRKVAVSSMVRPPASSFVRSLISVSDQGSSEVASMLCLLVEKADAGERFPAGKSPGLAEGLGVSSLDISRTGGRFVEA